MKARGWGLGILTATAWLGAAVGAGAAGGPTGQPVLELTLTRRPTVVQPAPDPRAVEQDTEAALAQIRARERSEALVREALGAPSRRPDLSYDVWSGIQARNVRDALRWR